MKNSNDSTPLSWSLELFPFFHSFFLVIGFFRVSPNPFPSRIQTVEVVKSVSHSSFIYCPGIWIKFRIYPFNCIISSPSPTALLSSVEGVETFLPRLYDSLRSVCRMRKHKNNSHLWFVWIPFHGYHTKVPVPLLLCLSPRPRLWWLSVRHMLEV